jgi:hypothetical protein
MRSINANQSGRNVRTASSVWKFKLGSLVFLIGLDMLHKKDFGPRLVPVRVNLSHVVINKTIWYIRADQQQGNHMLQGDDRVIWGNLFKVLVVLIIVMLALIVLANVLA